MSQTLQQIFVANPITSNAATDLMYFSQSPYTAGKDAGMTYANFATQFGTPYTASALTATPDTNVTITLGGTPATALLHAASITLGWSGQLSSARGGTGVNNGTSTFTIGGNFSMVGAFTFGGTLTGNTAVTFPTSGTLATTSQIPTGAALTKADDTNVTLTLGGAPTTALVNAASITAGWTGQLSVPRGGSGLASATAFTLLAGGTTTTGAFQSLTAGTSGQFLKSNGSSSLASWVDLSAVGVTSITGTANQVLANATSGSAQIGAVTLTLPQDIATTSSPTFANLTLTNGDILDASGNTSAIFGAAASAVNYLLIGNNSTGLSPYISAQGTDANVTLALLSKGDAPISLTTDAVAAPAIVIRSGTTTQHQTNLLFANTSNVRDVTFQDSSGTVAFLSNTTNLSANNFLEGYTTTATAAGTTTLTVSSTFIQIFTGSTTQTITMPVTSTLVLGQSFRIVNNSTGILTINSSGANAITTLTAGQSTILTCILTSGTTAASWTFQSTSVVDSWVQYTPTFTGFGTPSGVVIFSRRVGSNLEIMGRFTTGTCTAVAAQMTLGYQGTNANVTSSNTVITTLYTAGIVGQTVAAASSVYVNIAANSGFVNFGIQNSGNSGFAQANATACFNNASLNSILCTVPIAGW